MENDGRTTSVNFEGLSRATRFVKLPKKIDDAEMLATTAELVAVDRKILAVEDEKREDAKFHSDRLKGLKSQQEDLLERIGTGSRTGDVQVEVGYDWATGKKYTKRLDTGEILPPTDIDEAERQMQLEGLEPSQFDEHLEKQAEAREAVKDEPESDEPDDDEPEGESADETDTGAEEETPVGEETDIDHDLVQALRDSIKTASDERPRNAAGEFITCKCGAFLQKKDREFGICAKCDKKQAKGSAR